MHGEQEEIATLQTEIVTPQHSSFCHVHAIVRIVQWEENSEMRLAQNIAVYGDKMLGKMELIPAYGCFSTMDSFRFEEIVSGNGAFQEI